MVSRSALQRPPQEREWQQFVFCDPGKQLAGRNIPSDHIFIICAGWAYRYIQLWDGSRQILKFLLPGDLFSPTSIFEKESHFSVKALTSVQLCRMVRSEFREKYLGDRELQSAVEQSCVAEARFTSELMTVLSKRSAEERIAYLLLHLMQRIATSQVIRGERYPFPLRQQHIADAVGLTQVHVSRVLGLFRERGILALSEGVLEIRDLPELRRIGLLEMLERSGDGRGAYGEADHRK